MRRRHKTVTTTVTHEVTVIRRPLKVILCWCAECGRQVRMVMPEEAAALAGVSLRTIYRRVEEGRLHFTETPEGLLYVCLNSFEASIRPRAKNRLQGGGEDETEACEHPA